MNASIQGTGPVAVFLHGIPTSGRLWDYVVRDLQPSLTCVVAELLDAVEALTSADEPPGPAQYADRLAQELDDLRERLSVPLWHVVGHDAGSVVAVHYAVRFPHRTQRLVLCSAPLFPDFQVPWFFRLVRAPVLGEAIAPAITAVLWRVGVNRRLERRDAETAAIVEAFHQPFRGRRGARRFVRLLRWGDPVQVLGPTSRLLRRVTAPTLIVHGRRERVVPPSFALRAAAQIPNAEVRVIDGGHFLPLDRPDALSAMLQAFLEPQPASTSVAG